MTYTDFQNRYPHFICINLINADMANQIARATYYEKQALEFKYPLWLIRKNEQEKIALQSASMFT